MQTKPLIDRPTLEQIVDRDPLQVPPDATILDAIVLMSQGQHSSCVLVVDGGSLIGIFTERDAVRPIASGMDLATTEIARAIEQPAIHLILDRNQNLSTALSLMRQHRIHHLPAIDEFGQSIGLITRDRVEEAIWSLESVEDRPRQQLQVELELRLRQQQFASLLENSPDIIFRLDLQLRHIYISPSIIETSGLYPQEFLGKTGRELGLPASACDIFEGACREAIATGELTRVEYEIADRQYVSRLIPERSASGAIESLMGITEEMGNRQRQEAIAAANLRDTQLLQELSARLTSETDIQVLYDEILRAAIALTRADAGTLQILDAPTQELLLLATKGFDRTMTDRFARVSARSHSPCGIALDRGERSFVVFDRPEGEDPDGSSRMHVEAGYLSAQSTPLIARSGKQIGMVSTHWCHRYRPSARELRFLDLLARQAADSIEHQQAAAALRSSEELHRLALDLTNTASWDWNLTTGEVVWSHNTFRILGLTPDAVTPTYTTWRDCVYPEDLERLESAIALHLQNQTPYSEEYRVVYPDGTIHWLLSKGQGVYDAAGQAVRMVGITMDICDRKQAEIQLQETSAALSNALEGISRLDDRGRYTFINQAYARTIGYKPEEAIGMSWQQTIHPDDLEAAAAAYQELRSQGKVELEVKGLRKDGSVFDKQIVMVSVYNEQQQQQQFVGHYCFMKDISDRKQAEAAIKQSERKFRAIFDNTFGFMGLLSVEGMTIEVNQTALNAIAGDRSRIIGQPFWETPWWTHFPQQQEQLRQAIASAARGEFVRFETQHLWPDGTVAVVDFSLKPFVDEANNVAMLIFEGREISDRKQLEIALQTSEEKLRLALDLNSIGIWEWNIATGVVFWNASHFFMLGYQPGECEPSYQLWRDRVHPDDIGFAEQQIIQALENHTDYEAEFRLVLDDGSIRWLHSKGRGLYDDAGKPLRMVGVEYDITDRKQAEAALHQNQKMFSALVDNAPCGIYLVDAEFRLQRINQGSEAVFSNIDPLIGRDFAEILRIVWQEPFATEAIDRFRYTLATGESYYSPTTVKQRANIDEIQAYDWQIHRIALPDGSDGVVCYFYDLSEIKRAEEIIRRTAQRDAFLVTLSDTLRPLADPMEIQATATRILGEYLGVNRALYFEVRGSDYVVERDYVNGADALAGTYPIDSFGQSLIAAYRSGRTVVQPDVSADPSLSPERQAAYIAIEIIAHIGIPLLKDGELVAGLAVHMNRSRVWTPEEVTLAEEVAERTWAAIERARAETALAKSEEKYRSLFDSIDEGFSPIEMIFDAAGEPINYRFLEVNRVFEQQTGLVGVTGKTILDVIPDFEGSIIERYGRVAIEGKSIRFEHCVAAMDNSWFNVYASRIGGEGSRQVAVVFDNITDRKRREANLAFLAAIAEDFSSLSTVEEIIQAVGTKIGAHLQVTNCNFCEVDEVGDELVYLGRWNAEEALPLPDRICLSEQTSEDFRRRVRAGETIASDNTQINPVTNAEANAAIGALSFITVPFHKDGEWKYLFSIHDSIPHAWRSDEIELVRELANRTFPRLDRARAEAALRENAQLLRLALAGAKAGSWDWELATGKLTWSPEMYDLYGLDRDRIDPAGDPLQYDIWYNKYLHPDDRQKTSEYLASVVEQHLSEIQVEHRILHTQKEIRWLLGLGRLTVNERGEPQRFNGITLDISDRKQAELALQESEQKLSLFVKHAPACVAMFDRQMNYLALSQRWVDLYHLGAIEAVVGRSHYELLPTIPDRWRQVYRQGLEGLIQRCDEDRFTLPDGSLQWLKWEVQPWETGTGEVGGILIFVEDISDRKLAEQKIREQAALLDIASDAIFVRDLEHRILYWNQGAERLYGWTAAEAIDRKAYELLQTEATQLSEITQTILDRGEWRGELQKIAKTDREVIVEASWTLVRDDAGQPKFILSVETDITQKKQLEAQFYHAQRLESLGTLASGIAHDLNNVLTPILAIAQLLRYQEINLDARSQKMLQMLEDCSKRGANLVKQILTFARGNESERISLSVVPLLQEVVQIAQQTFPKSIAVRHNLAGGEIGLVSADPTQLHQIFVNLCVNARDAMPDGGTLAISAENYYVDEIFAQMHPDARGGNYVCVTVADTGTGIPAEIRDRIFEPFFTTKDIGKGTGLGLSILLGIVKSYGGFVEVRSQPGAGSQFKVYLPILQAVSALVEEQTNLPRGRGETILVVDDEANILQVARTLLEAYNYRVLTASNGIEALARYIEHKHEIQVVLMDMMMPEMDGFKAINTLQKMNPQIKIVAISGLSSDYRKKARSLGIDNYLSKPFTATELLQSIMTVDS